MLSMVVSAVLVFGPLCFFTRMIKKSKLFTIIVVLYLRRKKKGSKTLFNNVKENRCIESILICFVINNVLPLFYYV